MFLRHEHQISPKFCKLIIRINSFFAIWMLAMVP